MERRLAVVTVAALFCLFSIIFGAALLSEAVAPSPVEELLRDQNDFREGELDRLGSEEDPIGYGGEPGPLTDYDDVRVRYGAVAEPYWRTASYARFTGSTWQRYGEEAIAADVDDAPSGTTRTFTVESWAVRSILPAPWRPLAVDDDVTDSLTVRRDGSFEVTDDLTPGRTVRVTSEIPDWTYEELEDSDFTSDAPAVYTTLPGNQPDRLAERTDEITADAETPYGTAVLVERWLKLSREYSANATASTDWVADEFVFERENGTSEMFASAMVAMLRTQDVPARYVTGFAPGERIATGEEVVRGRHAHAWVEVYFEDVGWVTFDPTPPERILDRYERLDADVELRSWNGAPAETPQSLALTDGGIERAPERATAPAAPEFLHQGLQSDLADGWERVDPAPNVTFRDQNGSVLDTLIPGTTVLVEVTRDGEPLTGHRVSFDGGVVGVTDAQGRVAATLPYVDTISVRVEKPVASDSDDDEVDNGTDGTGTGGDDALADESGGGALNPGDQTGVGGDLGLDPETFGNTDTSVHLRVESSAPAYWRTDAYDRFTGAGWERTGGAEPFDGNASVDTEDGTRIDYEVTLERRARAVPTAWQPVNVSGVEDLVVTDRGGIRAESILPIGTTYEGTSVAPVEDVEVLRAASGEDPTAIRERYTQLPDNTTDRLVQLSGELTADQPTRFDAAMNVQRWLRNEKEYSLAASATSTTIADEFVFEMDAGYCEYFATAMVAMLRTQDIPARYVIGYTPGDEVGDGVYEVRGMNAHAWVEVYFPDVGWVTFDPTPGDERLATQQEALREEDPDADYRPNGEGSPGETFRPGEIQRQTDEIIDASDYEVGGYADHLDAPDEVVVGEEREPFSDQIRFIIAPAGDDTTRESLAASSAAEPASVSHSRPAVDTGDVTPWTGASSDVTVSTREGVTREGVTREGVTRESLDEVVAGGGGMRGPGRVHSPGRSATASSRTGQAQLRQDGDDLNVSLETDIDVTLGDETRSGRNLTVTATIDGVPVPKARVESRTPDGRTVLTTARTDADGRAALEVPYHERVKILVRRGAAYGTVDHEVDVDLTLAVEGDPHPGSTVPVTVSSHGEPASGVTVTGGNETGPGGNATATVPYATEGEIAAERGTARATVPFAVQPEMTVTGDALVGSDLQVTVTADGRPIDGLRVSPDAAPTGPDGTTTLTVPFESAVTVVAQRGDIRLREVRATSGELAVATAGRAIPGTEITVTVTAGGEPVPEASIALGGDQVAVTGSSGTATVRIPLDPRAGDTITARRGELRARTSSGASIGWLWLVGGLILAGIGGMVVVNVARRRTDGPLAERLLLASIRAATVLQRHVEAAGAALRRFVRQPEPRTLLDRVMAWSRSVVESPREHARGWPVVGTILRFLAGEESEADRRNSDQLEWQPGTSDGPDDWPVTGTATVPATDRTVVDDVWDRFTGIVDARPSDTPSEVARRAREEGYPRQAVDSITATYLRYRYGPASVGDDDAESIQEALSHLEREGTR